MRFYMVDRVIEYCPFYYVEGVKCISMSDDVFNEHFPGYPIFPGSLILEGLAQLSGFFFERSIKDQGLKEKRAVLTMVKRMKYKEMVFPGDRLIYRAEVKAFYPDEYAVSEVKAIKDNKVCAEGELIFCFIDIIDDQIKKINEEILKFMLKDVKIIKQKQ